MQYFTDYVEDPMRLVFDEACLLMRWWRTQRHLLSLRNPNTGANILSSQMRNLPAYVGYHTK